MKIVRGDQNFSQTHTHTPRGTFYKCCFSAKIGTSAEINDIILNSIEGENMDYWSVVSVLEVDYAVQYPLEFLNTLNPPGFPAHRFILKIGTPIMLLPNLCSPKLDNGIRLHVTAVQKNVVEANYNWMCRRRICHTFRLPLWI